MRRDVVADVGVQQSTLRDGDVTGDDGDDDVTGEGGDVPLLLRHSSERWHHPFFSSDYLPIISMYFNVFRRRLPVTGRVQSASNRLHPT